MAPANTSRRLAVIILTFFLTGCGGTSQAASTPEPTPERPHATASASLSTTLVPPTGTPEPTPTLAPVEFAEPGFTFTGEDPAEPVVEHAPIGAWNGPFINPGAMAFHAGKFHMLLNGFLNYPGVTNIGYLTSLDGRNWTLAQNEPVLTSAEVPYAAPGIMASSVHVLDDGTWVLYFSTINNTEPSVIGRATAETPLGPWTVDPQPVLSPGPEGSWDDRHLVWPDVVKVGEGWVMYYAGENLRGGGMIGRATSPDGIVWTKYDDPGTTQPEFSESDPIMMAIQDWEIKKPTRPEVEHTPDGWVMVYTGGDLTKRGLAASPDGIHWTVYPENPIISRGDFPIPGSAWDTAMVFHNGTYYYFMEIGSGTEGTDIYLATHAGNLTE